MSSYSCFACNKQGCYKNIKHSHDIVVIKALLCNGNEIMICGKYMYDGTVIINYKNVDYHFYPPDRPYLKYRLNRVHTVQRDKIFIYTGIATGTCCNVKDIRSINETYLRLFEKANTLYLRKKREIKHEPVIIIKKPVTYEDRMEKWYNDMDALRCMLINKV
jgi:hypothetical protein